MDGQINRQETMAAGILKVICAEVSNIEAMTLRIALEHIFCIILH